MPPQETKQKHPFNLSDEKVERLAAATLNFYHRFLLRKMQGMSSTRKKQN